MSIEHWPEGEHPREELLERDAGALSDAELLTTLLRVGTRGISAVDLACYLLNGFDSLGKLINADIKSLSSYKGMGTASFTRPVVIRGIGQRILNGESRGNIVFSNPQTIADYLRLNPGHEHMGVSYTLLLNRQNQLIAMRELSRGTMAEDTVYIRGIVRFALDGCADSPITVHSRPGDSIRPSEANIRFTRRLAQASGLVDISLLDHFIVAAKEVYSLRETGYMD